MPDDFCKFTAQMKRFQLCPCFFYSDNLTKKELLTKIKTFIFNLERLFGTKTGLRPMKIVIVEDEKNVQEELRLLLESAAYEVTAIEEFNHVSMQIESENPDLVLLDVSLPGLNGRILCRCIPAIWIWNGLRILRILKTTWKRFRCWSSLI